MLTFLILCAGIVLLLAGGTALVRGASGLAGQYGVSPLLIGLTVVAFGTSAPELVVNIIGSLRNQTDLAFGNIVGSNLANLGLVLCTAALIKPMAIEGQLVRRDLPLLLLATCMLLVVALDQPLTGHANDISRSDGLILLLLFSVFIYISISDVLTQRDDPLIENMEEIRTLLPAPLISATSANWIYVLIGVVSLGFGGHLTVTEGAELARLLGLPPVVVGMIVVAIGTSMPELVTSVIAAMRNESDLCVGNVVGSNLFNCLFVLPISALIRPIPIPQGGISDILLTLAFSAIVLCVFFLDRATLNRKLALFLLLAYTGYMVLRALP